MKFAIMGYGTVGSGVYKIIQENQDVISARLGEAVEVAYVLDLRDFPGDPAEQVLTKDVQDILKDDEVTVVVECLGGQHPAYDFSKACLEKGKTVVTSNKEMVSIFGAELLQTAKEHQCELLFEASVGGGIPVIRVLQESLLADKVYEIEGILNGTTNYILTCMEEEGSSYEASLKQAQELGYAERNPEADVEGYDTCRKIAILASMISGHTVRPEDIPTVGISKITAEDIQKAKNENKRIRLIAHVLLEDGAVKVQVGPQVIPLTHPLANIVDVYNGILIQGNMVGSLTLEGKGAGKEATASAVTADVLNALIHQKQKVFSGFTWDETVIPVSAF